MRKLQIILLLSIVFATIPSCEVDDICVQEVLTPKMIIEFYDATEIETKKNIEKLTVWAENKDSLFIDLKRDSISIPLDFNTEMTKYYLAANSIVDTLYIYHINKDVFVSRSCGYKVNYELKPDTHTSNEWIIDFETASNPQLITNEKEVHIKIYH